MNEPFRYRLRKFAVQQLSRFIPCGDQHERLRELDWDVMIILDACRFDVFNEVVEWPVERVRSPASKTAEWLSMAEKSGLFKEKTIVTANANYSSNEYNLDTISYNYVEISGTRRAEILRVTIANSMSRAGTVQIRTSVETGVTVGMRHPDVPLANTDTEAEIPVREHGNPALNGAIAE